MDAGSLPYFAVVIGGPLLLIVAIVYALARRRNTRPQPNAMPPDTPRGAAQRGLPPRS